MSFRSLLVNALWHLCGLLPMKKNSILFSSYNGKGYSDSPKAIAQALLESGADLNLFWLVNSEADAASLPDGISPVYQYNKLKRIIAYTTSRVWVDNCRKSVRTKRPGQFYLQTWHGFALKRIEKDVAHTLPDSYVDDCLRDSSFTDLVISGSGFMDSIFRNSFWYPDSVEICRCGTPRNDIFFRDSLGISRKIRNAMSLPEDRKIVLYAPTFRANRSTDCYGLDAARLKKACETRFGGIWTVMIRLHPTVSAQSAELFPYDGIFVVDGTAYPDMQELLAGVDLLITDYSSSMFDYALSGKPCIQFATDIESYKMDRNFYIPLDSMPFPMAVDNDALESVILGYDAVAWSDRWTDFRKRADVAFAEDGNAALYCADRILKELGIRQK